MSRSQGKNKTLKDMPQKTNFILEANQALKKETFSVAVSAAEAAMAEHPENPEALMLLATAYERAGQIEKAIQLLQNCNKNIQTAASHFHCAELCISANKIPEAIAQLQASLGLQPRNNPAREKLIWVYRATHQFLLAYIEFLEIQKDRPLTVKEKSDLIDCINCTNFLNYQVEMLAKINQILEDDRLDRRRLSGKVGELVLQAFPDLAENIKPSLDHPLANNEAFLGLLKKMPMSHVDIDFFLTSTRRLLLMTIAEQGQIADEYLPLCLSIATQNFLNEYIHSVSAEELEIVDSLHQLLSLHASDPQWRPVDSEAIFVTLLMYEPLSLLQKQITLPLALNEWTENLNYFAQKQLIENEEEIALAQHISAITPMSPLTPAKVRQLYEENPYPRWLDCTTNPIESLGNYFRSIYPHLTLGKEFYNMQPSILVAGCGTGKQAIEVAFQYPGAKITAFDLSLRSLGYAKRMAKKLNVPNVEFFQGDILELQPEMGTYDMIECCGVLHHMVDPIAGWKKLIACLNPKGIMHIALYSRLARQEINVRREQIAALKLTDSREDMQKFRNALLSQRSDQNLLKFRDFYVASEFRDLLFHPQESQYTLEEIQQILIDLNLTYVAMQIDPNTRHFFRKQMPDANELDWRAWQQLEIQHPIIFSSMYSFWCQKK